jgi:nitrate/nitrite transporter NarK
MPRPMLQACFVCCQYWCTAMFSPNVVGTANAFSGGWGNLGGGATQLVKLCFPWHANNAVAAPAD